MKHIVAYLEVINNENDSRLNTKYPIYEGENLIGSDPVKCKVVINKPGIDRTHAKIIIDENGEIELEDLNS